MPFKYILLIFVGVYFLTILLGILIRCYRQGYKAPIWAYAVCAYLYLWIVTFLIPLMMAISILKGKNPVFQKWIERVLWSIVSIPVGFLATIGSFHELIYKVIWKPAEELNNNLELIRHYKMPKSQGRSIIALILPYAEKAVLRLHETGRIKYV